MNDIDHTYAKKLIQGLLNGMITEQEKAALATHLRTCRSCRLYAGQIEKLEIILRQSFHDRWDSAIVSSEGIVAALLKESRVPIRNKQFPSYVSAAVMGVALIIMISFAISVLPKRGLPLFQSQVTYPATLQSEFTPTKNQIISSTQISPSVTSELVVDRTEVISYTVLAGDTIFGIAEKFNLKPETILWGNTDTLGDNPAVLKPGMILNILPVDGVYHRWSTGENLETVAKNYGVSPDVIIQWPGNHLNLKTIGDLSNLHIEPGYMLVIPGGHRPFDQK